VRNKTTYRCIILALIFTLIGCAPERPTQRDYKEFESRGYPYFDLEPYKKVIVTFEVYEVDDFVGWDASWGPADVKLVDPEGASHPWKRTRDSEEGFEAVFHFEATNPLPGKWQMIFTSKSWKTEHYGIWMYAESDKEGAYIKKK
jgi:hypothetical protein